MSATTHVQKAERNQFETPEQIKSNRSDSIYSRAITWTLWGISTRAHFRFAEFLQDYPTTLLGTLLICLNNLFCNVGWLWKTSSWLMPNFHPTLFNLVWPKVLDIVIVRSSVWNYLTTKYWPFLEIQPSIYKYSIRDYNSISIVTWIRGGGCSKIMKNILFESRNLLCMVVVPVFVSSWNNSELVTDEPYLISNENSSEQVSLLTR
jgi:hypothetical protein